MVYLRGASPANGVRRFFAGPGSEGHVAGIAARLYGFENAINGKDGMTRILLAGVAVADFVLYVGDMPARAEKYRAEDGFFSAGGNAANSAVAAARLGADAILAARLGDDPLSSLIRADLEREHVDTSMVQCVKGAASSFSSIYIDRAGERQIMNFRGRNLGENADWLDDAPPFDVLLADNRWPYITRRAIEIARQRNLPAVVDAEPPFDEDVVAGATHVAFSCQAIREYTGIDDPGLAVRAAAQRLNTWVCATDGANGAYYPEDGNIVNVPAIAVEAVDTLGAGDVWHAAFALMTGEGADIRDAVLFANAAGSLKCTRAGGRNGAPGRRETEQFMRANKT